MSTYDKTSNPKFSVNPGQTVASQTADSVTVNNTAYQQLNVPSSVFQPQKALSMEVIFSANPGAFEVDIQDADTDTDGAYQTIPNAKITTSSAGSDGKYYARFELSPFVGNWVRPFWVTAPANSVTVSVNFTR